MTLRDLTPEQEKELRADAQRNLDARNNTRREGNLMSELDYQLAYSDGVKAILARITTLP